MTRFTTVFYGLDSHFELPKYLQRTFRRTAGYAPLMTEEYFRDGGRHTSSEFDDRSTAFGVASICYSHAITDLVNLYYYIWEQSGGDVRSKIAMRSARVIPNRIERAILSVSDKTGIIELAKACVRNTSRSSPQAAPQNI